MYYWGSRSQLVSLQVDEGVPGDGLRTPQLSGPDQAALQEADGVLRAMIQKTCQQTLRDKYSQTPLLVPV